MNTIKGKTILVTRAKDSDSKFEQILTSLGAAAEHLPVIEIKPVSSFSELDKRIERLETYEGVFFTSTNAVKYFFERLALSEKKFPGKIYTVGAKTKASVESYGYKVYFAPPAFSAEELADTIDINEVKGRKFLFPKGNLGRDLLKNKLGSVAEIDEVIVYENVLPDLNEIRVKSINNLLNAGKISCICFFSPSGVENFLKLFPDFKQNNIKIAVIGSTTEKSVIEHGLKADILPDSSTSESLAEAINKYYKTN